MRGTARFATPGAGAGIAGIRSTSPKWRAATTGRKDDGEVRPRLRVAVHRDADDRGGEYRVAVGPARDRALAPCPRQCGRGGLFGVGAVMGDRRAPLGEPVGSARSTVDDPAGG